ncbi:hypothetical protein SELMODRAFT_424592 [Selaginella moellendorffii]|uniref:Peptidase M16 C-terminal domain-containing protein n=1 Tax=Selaginella moellendorffii TaxID=88036 RepID=D8SQE6_SELML|nr:hypothetical protein SELMODRAFT_424592 [Selaginella moellendorffii]
MAILELGRDCVRQASVTTSMEQEILPIPEEFPPLPDFFFSTIRNDNGLRVFVLEDHELGLEGGGNLEPEGKSMAARIEASSSGGSMGVGCRCLEDDLKTVFSIFSDGMAVENFEFLLRLKLRLQSGCKSCCMGIKVFMLDCPSKTRYVRMGELGTTIADPDVFALDVFNGVLNGFGGLLFDEIRSKEGLAYSVAGGWSASIDHRVNLRLYLPKLSTFVFCRESQLARVLIYDLFGIDQNLPLTYKKKVEEVTSNDILEGARKHLHPDLEPIVIVTDAKALGTQMPPFVQLQGR